MHQKSILITGAAGFLGREVLRQLVGQQPHHWHSICPIDNYDPLCGSSEDVPSVEFWDMNSKIYFTPTHIIHLAAYGRNLTCEHNPEMAHRTNVGGTIKMLELARLNKAKILVCSSNIVLSEYPTVYRKTKRLAEAITLNYAKHRIEAMILRPSNIGGPGQSRTEYQPCCFAAMDRAFEKQGFIELTGDGMQKRDFINVRDVARAFVMALDNFTSGATLDICTGKRVPMIDIVRMLDVPFEFVGRRPGDSRELVSDHRPAANLLGFEAQIGLEQTVRESFPSVMSAKTRNSN